MLQGDLRLLPRAISNLSDGRILDDRARRILAGRCVTAECHVATVEAALRERGLLPFVSAAHVERIGSDEAARLPEDASADSQAHPSSHQDARHHDGQPIERSRDDRSHVSAYCIADHATDHHQDGAHDVIEKFFGHG
jgi:hypothetical protein